MGFKKTAVFLDFQSGFKFGTKKRECKVRWNSETLD